jgi:transmembrane sensor
MSGTEERHIELARKWMDGTITEEERKEFTEWYNKDVSDPLIVPNDFANSEDELKRRIYQKVRRSMAGYARTVIMNLKWKVAAVFLIIGLGSLPFYFLNKEAGQMPLSAPTAKKIDHVIEPGGNKAMLTLADGSVVLLDTADNGDLVNDQNIKIIKLDDGQLVYSVGKNNKAADSYNLLSTPRGGQYNVLLADGTRVWLNSASTLRFPLAFNGSQRQVELKGEAYFEVAKNNTQPFLVRINDVTVRVLGTHFNVMAYEDEPVLQATLVEGSVSIHNSSGIALLKPGQQAEIKHQGDISIRKNVNVNDVISWKNGMFSFEGVTIETIMRQLARWYDIDIKIEADINDHFTGEISKSVGIEKVFRMLQLTGAVSFIIKDNKVIVRK